MDELAVAKKIMAQIIQDAEQHNLSISNATEQANRLLDRMWACGLESALDPADRLEE